MYASMRLKISRAPIFRKVKDSLGFTPRFAFGIVPATGYDQVIMVTDDWAIKEYVSGTVTDRSGSITGTVGPPTIHRHVLADILYLNRGQGSGLQDSRRHELC